jgi:hypothetical protein
MPRPFGVETRRNKICAALRYLKQVGIDDTTEQSIIDYISSLEAIYDYQLYEMVTWFTELENVPPTS